MAGMLIPKTEEILGFFPKLDQAKKNPRAPIDVVDEAGREWTFQFIYYNNRFFGGTRNEYRLTCMTEFYRDFALKSGDTVILTKHSERDIRISIRRTPAPLSPSGALRLGVSGWRVVEMTEDE